MCTYSLLFYVNWVSFHHALDAFQAVPHGVRGHGFGGCFGSALYSSRGSTPTRRPEDDQEETRRIRRRRFLGRTWCFAETGLAGTSTSATFALSLRLSLWGEISPSFAAKSRWKGSGRPGGRGVCTLWGRRDGGTEGRSRTESESGRVWDWVGVLASVSKWS